MIQQLQFDGRSKNPGGPRLGLIDDSERVHEPQPDRERPATRIGHRVADPGGRCPRRRHDAGHRHVPDGFPHRGVLHHRAQVQWGVTDEILCCSRGILIGRLVTNTPPQDGRLVVVLLPRLDSRRHYDWPSVEDFWQTLLAIILSVPGALLHCERDTDQEPVPRIREEAVLVEFMRNVAAFCVDGAVACPTFSYESGGGNK